MNSSYKPRLLVTVILLSAAIRAESQDVPSANDFRILQNQPIHISDKQSEIRIHGMGTIGSNVFNADFLLNGINDQAIDDNYSRLNIYSRIGFAAEGGLTYTNYERFNADSGLIWYAGAGSSMNFGAEASQDLLKLALRGNKQFAGQVVEFGNTAFQYYSYDKVYGGVSGFFHSVKWSAGLSLIAGKDYFDGYVSTGNLETSTFGDSITGRIDADWEYTTGNDLYKGYGAGLDLSVAGEFGTSMFAKLTLSDVGFISWSDAQQRSMASDVNYQGYYYTFKGSERAGLNLFDSLSQDYIREDSGTIVRGLPMRLRIDLNNMIRPNHLLGLVVDYIRLSGYEPVFAVNHHWFISSSVSLESSVGFGGFGSLQWKERVHLQLGDKFGMSLGIVGLEGLIMNDIPLNGGGFFQAAYFL